MKNARMPDVRNRLQAEIADEQLLSPTISMHSVSIGIETPVMKRKILLIAGIIVAIFTLLYTSVFGTVLP
jgi:hypothetical protein